MINKAWLWCVVLFLASCQEGKQINNGDILGLWKIEVGIAEEDKKIPFFLELIEVDEQLKAAVWNGDEQIVHDSIRFNGDTLVVESPYFNSSLELTFEGNNVTGFFVDYSRKEYKMPLTGKYNLSQRFRYSGPLETKIDGKWQVVFSPNTADAYSAIGLFETDPNSMKGTFITETGDYRFLEGGFAGNQLQLSTFDGAHAFLFEASLKSDTLKGWFYSGKHWKEPFVAWKNDEPTLISPYEMTELVDAEKTVSFEFQSIDGEVVSSEDSVYANRPMLIQIMGSWCPNCMDEMLFLANNKAYIEDLGVQVVALSFERLHFEKAQIPLQKLRDHLNVFYPILYAGEAKKSEAIKSVPWLKQIKSYPTLIYVLPNKKVFKIHTGFYGPSTKSYYEVQSKEMFDDLKQLSKLSATIQ